jgi:hypothetical protein
VPFPARHNMRPQEAQGTLGFRGIITPRIGPIFGVYAGQESCVISMAETDP